MFPSLFSHPGRQIASLVCMGTCLLLSSCGDGRTPVYPVHGTVLVDGKPAADVQVQLFPVEPVEADVQPPLFPNGRTDADGKFDLSTYNQGDGAPAGEYLATFQWLTYRVVGNQWSGPDKLGGRYSDPKTSTIRVRIDEAPMELPPFKLEKQ
jgi:hypothetical protein